MQAIEERICDRKLLRLLRAAMEEGVLRRSDTGTPRGGVVSPLLANVYLDRLDRDWQARGCGTIVRYADDLVVMCGSERDARRALAALRALLAELGLRRKEAKTRIVYLREGGEGFDFPRLPPPLRARPHPALAPSHLPRSLALTSGDAARPRGDP
jgi:RNA-directed DNA polymerase